MVLFIIIFEFSELRTFIYYKDLEMKYSVEETTDIVSKYKQRPVPVCVCVCDTKENMQFTHDDDDSFDEVEEELMALESIYDIDSGKL